MNTTTETTAIALLSLLLVGCTAGQHIGNVRDEEGERLTVGTVQREITLGMSAAEVATVLGSPNIVTGDRTLGETWIYDRISTEVAYSQSSGGIAGLIFGVSGGGIGVGSTRAGANASSQRTLTVIIRFDADERVRDFTYHTSRF